MNITIIVAVASFVAYIFFKRFEAAYSEINKNRIKRLADDGDRTAEIIFEYIEKIDVFRTCIKFVVNLLTMIFAYSVIIFFLYIKNVKGAVELYIDNSIYIFFPIAAVVIAEVMLLFGNTMAESNGLANGENIVCSSIKFINILSMALSPFVYLVLCISALNRKILGIKNEDDENVTEEEIRLLVEASEGDGAIEQNEKEMINNIFEFSNTIVGNIATHRTDIVAAPIEASLEEVIEIVNGSKFSRIPVYDENIDDIVGIFRVRDLLKFFTDDSYGKNFKLNDIIIEPYFVPFSKKTDELFEDMQKNKVQMAVVIDEYGGTAGIVTIEDLIEEIVGNIFDEYDEVEEEIRQIDENTYLIKGTTEIDDVSEALKVELEDSENYDTIGGYLIGRLERIPDDDERPKVVIGQCVFKIEKIFEKRIELIKVHKNIIPSSE